MCGVGDYSYWLAKEFEKRGYHTTIITQKIKELKNQNNIFPLDKFQFLGIINSLKKIAPQIVIIQYVSQLYGRAGIAPGIAILPLLIKLKINTKVITTFHELYIPWSGRDFLVGIIQRIQTFLLLLFSDVSVVTTNLRKKQLKQMCRWKKIYKIPVGSNIKTQNSKLKTQNSKPNILSIFGTLHPERDFVTVFKVLSITKKTKLWIIGNIDKNSFEYKKLKNKAQELRIERRIKWFFSVPENKVSYLLSNSSIYLSPEFGGPSGRRTTLAAALSFGLPIIAYNGESRDSIFKNNENIILVPPKNHKILAKKINELIKNKELREKLGKEAKKAFNKYFSWTVIGNEYDKIFKTIV
jgi:glycosyltransferase involved in cell wall biosynthesis